MIQQLHSDNVPHQGTLGKLKLCPTGVLGYGARGGHMNDVLTNRISTYRKMAGLSQEALADRIGTTRNMMVKLEGGSRVLNSSWLEKIGETLNVPPYLLIAPPDFLPNETELAQMLLDAQQTLPTNLPYSEWPRAIAAGLHIRLRQLAGDRANADNADH